MVNKWAQKLTPTREQIWKVKCIEHKRNRWQVEVVSSGADGWFHRWYSGRLTVTQIAGSDSQGCAGWQRLGGPSTGMVRSHWERRKDGLRRSRGNFKKAFKHFYFRDTERNHVPLEIVKIICQRACGQAQLRPAESHAQPHQATLKDTQISFVKNNTCAILLINPSLCFSMSL